MKEYTNSRYIYFLFSHLGVTTIVSDYTPNKLQNVVNFNNKIDAFLEIYL